MYIDFVMTGAPRSNLPVLKVTIKPPYDVENVAAVGKDDHQMCIRIQQMVSHVRHHI